MEAKKGFDYIGNAVVFYCHDGQGNFLMSLRGNNSRDEQNTWDPGGGAIEFGDTIEQTLRKEIMEEYCTDVLEFEFLGFRDVHRINQDKPTHWIALDFKVLVDPKKAKNGEPHKMEKIGWFRLDNLPDNMHSQWPIFFGNYKDRLK